jgi:diaminopimelate decarboxylase
MGQDAPVSIRVNPNVDPKTHPYISTGLKGNKFGVAHERTLAPTSAPPRCPACGGGIDCHIGSQITDEAPYLDAMDRMLDLVRRSRRPASPSTTSTLAAAWASTTTATQPPAADALWASCWPNSMRAVLASASS